MKRHNQRRTSSKKHTDELILHGWVRRDGLGITLLAVSAAGIALNGIVFPRLARIGGILQQVSTGILFGRELQFVAVNARRQRPLPRLLTFMELLIDGVATAAGFWVWIWQPLISRRLRRTGMVVQRGWLRRARSGRVPRGAAVSRVAAVVSFAIHTVRLAIYLTPGRGLREGPAD